MKIVFLGDSLNHRHRTDVVFCMCELPRERERKGEEVEKDRDNIEETLRAAIDAKLL